MPAAARIATTSITLSEPSGRVTATTTPSTTVSGRIAADRRPIWLSYPAAAQANTLTRGAGARRHEPVADARAAGVGAVRARPGRSTACARRTRGRAVHVRDRPARVPRRGPRAAPPLPGRAVRSGARALRARRHQRARAGRRRTAGRDLPRDGPRAPARRADEPRARETDRAARARVRRPRA